MWFSAWWLPASVLFAARGFSEDWIAATVLWGAFIGFLYIGTHPESHNDDGGYY
jgi:hypothetical protein